MPADIPAHLAKLLPGDIRLLPPSGDYYAGTADAVGGRFKVTRTAVEDMGHLKPNRLRFLRRKMWEANRTGVELTISSYEVENFSGALPSFKRRTDDLLDFIVSKAEPINALVPVSSNIHFLSEAITIVGIDDPSELRFFIEYLAERGFVGTRERERGGNLDVFLKPGAFVYREGEQRQAYSSRRAFVAMWFGKDVNEAWQHGIQPAIAEAGYEAFRIDQHEHINRIDDEILSQIRTSRFLVADFTSEAGKPRGGVYFEAGFALGLDLPVIWTAHERMINEIHFDTRQYNHIFWKDPADLRQKLRSRIVALIGMGPLEA